jgi:hypothetical protein
MAARIVIPTNRAEATFDSVRNDCTVLLRQHAERVTGVRIERRRQGSGAGPLAEEIEVVRDTSESLDEHVAGIVDLVMKVIQKDAERPRTRGKVGPWLGAVILLSRIEKKPEIATLEVRIEDPDDLMSLETESVQIVNVVKGFLSQMCKEMVGIMAAAKEREQANAELVVGVSKSVGRESEARYKFDWRMQKSRERMHRHRVDETSKIHRARARWETIGDAAHDYKDVIENLTEYFTYGRRVGDPSPGTPTRPTQEEIDKVLRDEPFDKLRAIASEMIAETDAGRRGALSKQFRETMRNLDDAHQDTLRSRILAELGPARAKEILAWLHLPI